MINLINVTDAKSLNRIKNEFLDQNPNWAVIEANPEVSFPKTLAVLVNRKIGLITLEPAVESDSILSDR